MYRPSKMVCFFKNCLLRLLELLIAGGVVFLFGFVSMHVYAWCKPNTESVISLDETTQSAIPIYALMELLVEEGELVDAIILKPKGKTFFQIKLIASQKRALNIAKAVAKAYERCLGHKKVPLPDLKAICITPENKKSFFNYVSAFVKMRLLTEKQKETFLKFAKDNHHLRIDLNGAALLMLQAFSKNSQ